MRAAVISASGLARLDEVARPEPGPGEVRVKLEGCGVCGSNLPVWEGRPWFEYPLAPGAPGHEGWGRIDALGSGVTDPQIGERVAMLSTRAFAEYDIASAAEVVELPPKLDGMPFPGEALGCVMNIYRRCEIRPGDDVAVVGIGFLGALLTQLAAGAGARVLAISRRDASLEAARRAGASEAISLTDPDAVVKKVESLTGGGCARVIEAVGAQATLDLASRLAAVRGRLIVAGYHQDGERRVDMQLWNWRGLDVVNAHEREPAVYVEGIRQAVEAVRTGRLDPAPLYTHSFPLHRLDAALDALRDRPEGFMKAMVTA
jgi:threonine dehydrogenase-like Zn-dependent dehydrogenase